jgi:hypothetical protein
MRGSHSGGYEVFYILGYNAVYYGESQPKFRRNISHLKDEGNMFLRNID